MGIDNSIIHIRFNVARIVIGNRHTDARKPFGRSGYPRRHVQGIHLVDRVHIYCGTGNLGIGNNGLNGLVIGIYNRVYVQCQIARTAARHHDMRGVDIFVGAQRDICGTNLFIVRTVINFGVDFIFHIRNCDIGVNGTFYRARARN